MSENNFLFIREAGSNIRLDPQRILYIEARKNYSYVVTLDKNYLVLTPLKDWTTVLPAESFCRIHRAYIVAIDRIVSFDSRSVYMPGAELAIGEHYKDELLQKVIVMGGESRNRQRDEHASLPSLTQMHYSP